MNANTRLLDAFGEFVGIVRDAQGQRQFAFIANAGAIAVDASAQVDVVQRIQVEVDARSSTPSVELNGRFPIPRR